MSRGVFSFITEHATYTEQKKDWHVELIQSTWFWFDLLIDSPDGVNMMEAARKQLNALNDAVKNELDKRFVYFLASRPKIRFSTKRKPHYASFSGKLILYIEVGRERIIRRCVVKFADATGKPVKPRIEVTDRLITLSEDEQHKVTYSIYDFFSLCGIRTGIDTEVHYVGYTSDPSGRPIDRNHRGFGDMLHWTSRDDQTYDYFVFYNLFKVTSLAMDTASPINFVVSNAMIDEVRADEEGLIVEKILVKYFSTKAQELNNTKESTELDNSLDKLIRNHNIHSITFDIEVDERSDLCRFFSRSIKADDRHHFTCRMGQSGAEIFKLRGFSTTTN